MKNKSFEEAMEELEKVVDELENNELSLDESVDKFQKGMELSKYCNSLLEEAEKKITVLIDDGEGTMIEKDFKIEKEEKNSDDME